MDQILSTALEAAKEWLPNIAWAVGLFLVGRILIGILTGLVNSGMKRASVDEAVRKFLRSLLKMALLALLVIAVLGQLGVETTSFAAIIAAAGLAIGLSLQGTLGNFASGVLLIILRPFKVGDYVEVAGQDGTVEEIAIFATKLVTPDNKLRIIPNGAVAGSPITNYSAKDTRRVDMTFGVGYEDDLKKAKEVITEVVHAHPLVLAEPAPVVAVSSLDDSCVTLIARPWCNRADYWTLHNDLQEQMKLRLDAEGISIPYPQRHVHLQYTDAAQS